MLTQSQVHKENDDHEAIEVDIIVSNGDVINNHEHKVKYVKTWGEEGRIKDESVPLDCDVNNKEYGLFTNDTQIVNDMSPHNREDVDITGIAMKQVVTDKSGNLLLPTREDGSICDVNTF